jgi:hypothetical protein
LFCRHPDLEQSLLNYFGDNSTPAHLKMADTPGDDTTRLIPCLADNGSVSPFPLVAVRNVFVLPGTPITQNNMFVKLATTIGGVHFKLLLVCVRIFIKATQI